MCRNRLFTKTRTARGESIYRRCSSVVLQVGSNDLTDENCTVDDFVQSVQRYIQYLKRTRNVSVVIMAVLPRKLPIRYHMTLTIEQYNTKVVQANEAVKNMTSSMGNVFFWNHDRRLNNRNLLSRDGVHLNSNGVKRYWKSVRGAIMFTVRKKSYPH